MTVQDLISRLQELDPNRKIVFQGEYNAYDEYEILSYKDGCILQQDDMEPKTALLISGTGSVAK